MNKIVGYGLAAAAVVAVVFIGAQLLGSSGDGVGGPGTEATATPAASATPEATAEPSVAAGLPQGPFILWSEDSVPPGVQVTVTIPGAGWHGDASGGILVKNNNPNPPGGAGMVGPFFGPLWVYGDPCQWAGTAPEAPATTVDEFIAAMSAQPSRDASAPVDITLDGYEGQSITLHVPDDVVFSDCDQGYFGSWTVEQDLEPYRYHQGPGQIDEVWALDVDGQLMVFDLAYYEDTPAEDVSDMRSIMASARFGE